MAAVTALAIAAFLTASPAVPVEAPAKRRAVLIEQLLTEQRDTRIWYTTWGLGWATAAIAQFATLPWTSSASDRTSTIVWACASGAGALATLLLPPAALDVERRLGGDVEKEWVDVYNDEVLNQSLWMHGAAVLLNVIPFLVLGLAYKRWDVGFFLAGLAISEAQVVTFPQLLRRFGVR
jgi:hypothetical protein